MTSYEHNFYKKIKPNPSFNVYRHDSTNFLKTLLLFLRRNQNSIFALSLRNF